MFTGTIVQAPLATVIQTIADTAGLHVVNDGQGLVLVPTPQMTVTINDIVLGVYPNTPCKSCGIKLSPAWKFCPNCGQPTGRGTTTPGRTGNPPGTKVQKIYRGNGG